MVFVARGALARAEQEATRGAEIQRESAGTDTPIPTAGLHWLRGLVMSARGERDEALQCFTEEIAPGHRRPRRRGAGIRDPGFRQTRPLFARTPDPGPRIPDFTVSHPILILRSGRRGRLGVMMAVEAVMLSLLIASVVVVSASAREPCELRRDLADLSAGASAKVEAACGREGGWSGAPQAAQVSASPAPAIEIAAPGVTQELELNDGTRAIGRVESVHDGRLLFRTTAGVVMDVEIAVVRSLHPITGTVVNGEFWPADANPTRLFFAPTGRSLKKGEAYFGVYEIMLPFVQYGITDRISIGGGTPLFFGGGSGQPFWFTPKFAVTRGRTIDLAVGVLHFVNMGDASVGIAYAVATQGTTDAAFTVGGGYAYASEDQRRAGAPVVMVGAEKRLSRRLKFVTENYWFSGVGLASGGVRFMGERLSADIGLVSPLGVDEAFVFPMVNFVWKMK